MATSPLPGASQQAPPNFYQQAAAMSGSKAKPSPDDKQEFLTSVTKLLSVLGKMGKMKPNGVDISKYMKAAADSVEKALQATAGDGDSSQAQAGDATGDAGASATPPPSPDTGATGATS